MSEKGRSRPLTAEEYALWKGVARSVAPLRKPAGKPASKTAPAAENVPAKKSKTRGTPAVGLPVAMANASAKLAPAKSGPSLSPLDRRSRQRIARGSTAIDARLDLHGMTQDEAHGALRRFLRATQSRGGRTALVITGKGTLTGRGVLKRQVPHWLALPELRDIVLGFEDAAIPHGGEGALYVRIRRKRADAR